MYPHCKHGKGSGKKLVPCIQNRMHQSETETTLACKIGASTGIY